ncbi:Nif3-like dinuclear metal center hexameric protein [Fontivita pretiosa]|uniref:Nif3-like dinuclear metal center hexameric protein n=1 Tax=Fontivita pretiosa TaxID=2989684 RepID=UPI003D17B8B0
MPAVCFDRMKLCDVLTALEQIAPTRYAESWDNVGLLVGDPSQEVASAILTIDYTPQVAAEAQSLGCDLVIAYHPPIFEPLKRVRSLGPGELIFDAIRRGVAIYSPHTALDVAAGGTNDMLADAVGLVDRWPLKLLQPRSTQYKLVTFVPEKDLEKLSAALFAAGAGRIGNYSSCSFRTKGSGTFFAEEGAEPAVGTRGRLECVEEVRLETVVPIDAVDRVIRALRQNHPYEEPAFDLNVLAAAPEGVGMGRIGTMPPTPRAAIFERIKRELDIDHLLVAGPTEGEITRAAVCAGACGELLNDAIAQHAELYLSGEVRHHDALRAARAGVTVVCTLHSNSERAVLRRLAQQLSRRLPGLKLILSQEDRDPFALR